MKNIVAALIGAAVGAAVTWIYAKRHYESIIDDEVKSVRETVEDFEKRHSERKKAETENTDTETAAEVSYKKAVSAYGKPQKTVPDGPRVIDYDEMGENETYVRCTWVYFEDGVVTNDIDEIVEDAEAAIGTEFMHYFVDGTAYVVNDTRHAYYEILEDGRNYFDVNPKPKEG
jgi:hypothetical protein